MFSLRDILQPLLTFFFSSVNQLDKKSLDNTYDIAIYKVMLVEIVVTILNSRMGESVVLINPLQRIKGLKIVGLSQIDIGNKQAIRSIFNKYYRNIKKYYNDS